MSEGCLFVSNPGKIPVPAMRSVEIGQRHGEEVVRTVFPADDLLHRTYHVRMFGRHVVVLMQVGGQVVEMGYAPLDHQFPVTHADADLVRLVELPVEEVVLLLPLVVTQQGRSEGDAVEAVALDLRIEVLLGKRLSPISSQKVGITS